MLLPLPVAHLHFRLPTTWKFHQGLKIYYRDVSKSRLHQRLMPWQLLQLKQPSCVRSWLQKTCSNRSFGILFSMLLLLKASLVVSADCWGPLCLLRMLSCTTSWTKTILWMKLGGWRLGTRGHGENPAAGVEYFEETSNQKK